MRDILRFFFDNYRSFLAQVRDKFLLAICCLLIIPVGVPAALFFLIGLGGSFGIINSIGYGWRRLKAYAYRDTAPQWQGFFAT
jgi:hypothetical protein